MAVPDFRVPLPLAVWPVQQPLDWLTWVNEAQTLTEVEAIRLAVAKGRPFGDDRWQQTTMEKLDLQSSYRSAGRPKSRAQSGNNRT